MVRKGQYSPGDMAVYLPEASVLPDSLIEALGLTGRLAGSAKNRVKALRLRGCLSQGILYSAVPDGATPGDDVAELLGITKYEPAVPASMTGEMVSLFGVPIRYDIENFKAFPDVLCEGEEVEMTEKAHGTFCGIGVVSGLANPEMFGGDGVVYSKGLGGKGLVFKDVPVNASNIYVEAATSLCLHDRIRTAFPGQAVHVLGEVYGQGVQDLTYGTAGRCFAAFDISVDGAFLDRDAMASAAARMDLRTVPVLYRGPFSREVMYSHTDGKTVIGGGVHIREGVVVTPVQERRDDMIGRVILKSVSGDYLTRKGDATEFA